jgi:hypothetical protein
MNGRRILGVILLGLGIIFLLRAIGLSYVPPWHIITMYWPVLVIASGVALILRQQWLFALIFVVAALAASIYISDMFQGNGEIRQFSDAIPLQSADRLDLAIDYGAGKLDIGSGWRRDLIAYEISSPDIKGPQVEVARKDGVAQVTMRRQAEFGFRDIRGDDWRVRLSPATLVTMSLDYGAGEAIINMTDLSVETLDISCGATKNTIIFGTYPTKATISAGASSFEFKMPKGTGAKITLEGAATSMSLPGFTKGGDSYTNGDYNPTGDNIEVMIDAGASSVKVREY